MEVKRLALSDLDALDGLIRAYPFKPFRNYRMLSRRKQELVLRAEIEGALREGGHALFAEGDGGAAAVILRRLPWDSGFFGVPMGRLDYVLHDGGHASAAMGAALGATAEACRTDGIRHLTARADVSDVQAIGRLEDQGFRLMDALVTYIARPGRERPAEVREVGLLRPYRAEDAEQVVSIAREAYHGFRGRFHLDPHLPDERCDELYVEWARQCCAGRMAETMFVAENGAGEVHGFLAFRRREPVSSIGGVEVYGGGLGACRRDHPGAYMGLIRAGTLWAHERGGVAECQTQNYNFPTVRVYEAVGAQYVRADYTFHGWI